MIDLIEVRTHNFKNRVEELAFEYLDKILKPDTILYEPLTFNSIGGSYTPDIVLTHKGHLYLFEVKSSWNAPGASRTKRSMKEVAASFGFLGYFLAILPEKKHQKDRVIYVDSWAIQIIDGKRFKDIRIDEL